MNFDSYSLIDLFWIALPVFMLAMSKGGFPVGTVSLPILILAWPDEQQAARSAVGFLLPMLCAMDVFAMLFYRKHIQWRRLRPLLPATLGGVVVGSILFVSGESALLSVSDRVLKLCIGILGLLFVLHQATKKWILRHLENSEAPGTFKCSLYGFGAGLTSTLAHAAGPVMKMYLLPQKLPKLQFAATSAGFFWMLNLAKMIPFVALGRIHETNLMLAVRLLPIIPVGVAVGYGLVRLTRQHHYIAFIYIVLFAASFMLIVKSLGA
jgi:hypothetical protein